MKQKYDLGVDLGGTKVAIGIVDDKKELIDSLSFKTNTDTEQLSRDIFDYAKILLEKHNIQMNDINSLGIGVPGTVDEKKEVITYANNLGFVNVPMVELLQEYFAMPIYMDNDANVAAWAEYKAGSCKNEKVSSMVMVTLGTGVGAGFVIEDKLYDGCNRGAGEIGHMVIDFHGIPCNCGRRGCFENYASTTALMEQTQKAMEERKDTILWELCEGNCRNINGKIFFEAVKREDPLACEVLHTFQEYLTIGLLNIINIFQPDMLVIGGGISQVGDLLLKPVREKIAELVYTRDDRIQTKIVQAFLGNDAGMIGAALLCEEKTG